MHVRLPLNDCLSRPSALRLVPASAGLVSSAGPLRNPVCLQGASAALLSVLISAAV